MAREMVVKKFGKAYCRLWLAAPLKRVVFSGHVHDVVGLLPTLVGSPIEARGAWCVVCLLPTLVGSPIEATHSLWTICDSLVLLPTQVGSPIKAKRRAMARPKTYPYCRLRSAAPLKPLLRTTRTSVTFAYCRLRSAAPLKRCWRRGSRSRPRRLLPTQVGSPIEARLTWKRPTSSQS